MEADVLGTSPAMARVVKTVKRVAASIATVLLEGEEGTPKKEVASLIHELSGRKGQFVAPNLASIPAGLVASELFGYVRGAFTGAVSSKDGLIASAKGGTLFLDEVETAAPELQIALLRVLNDQSFSPVGSTTEIPVDVRVIASLGTPEGAKMLRRDLFYRLSTVPISIPPLRERREDILALAKRFLDLRRAPRLSDEAQDVLNRHSFPGNDRELYAVLEGAAVFAETEFIRPQDLALVDVKWKFGGEDIAPIRRELASVRADLASLERSSIKATPIWEGRRFETEPEYCFVLMPFAEICDLQSVYRNHVKQVVEKRCKLKCERADDITDISGVMQSVWESVNRARIIVAEMTERNPNVFYELGIAHTLGKPVIMITQSLDYVPSDLKHLRSIVYDYKPGLIELFEDALEKTIRRVLETTLSTPAPALRQE